MADTIFAADAFAEYVEWQTNDKKLCHKINTLLKDIQRNGYLSGLGKPEALKGRNAYSRRIDDYHRLVYEDVGKGNVRILSCKGHYENWD
ncbi:Txe/YoeB family addiction module toxin [Planctomycetales bacterium]|nr:Txe/YoeB family addiction module toxin [Planctomycetales bacterium]